MKQILRAHEKTNILLHVQHFSVIGPKSANSELHEGLNGLAK